MLRFAETRPVALPSRGIAERRFGDLAVGAEWTLRVDAPENPVIRRRHGSIALRQDELTFPAEACAEAFATHIKSFSIWHQHKRSSYPWFLVRFGFTAARIARFTATLA